MRTIHDLRLHPFSGMDVPSLLRARAAERGDHPFLIWEPFDGPDAVWSYAAFADRVERVAAGLVKRGVRPGDRILVHLDNCPEAMFAWYACARIGAVAVTTNARSSADELAYFAEHSGAVAGITQPIFADRVNGACPRLAWLAVTETDNGAPPEAGRAPDRASSFAALDSEPGGAPARRPDPIAPVGVQYTSGTTARPKGVLWTHANALWGGRVSAAHEDLRADDVHLTFLPLFHTNAQVYSVLSSLWAGGSVVLLPRFSASRFWPISVKHRCTWNSTVPFCLKALADQPVPDRHDYRLWGTAVCAPPTDARFRVRTIGWWGMTETITHGIVGDAHGRNRSGMVGRPAVGYDIAIRRDDGAPVEPGETGNLLIRGVRGLSLFMEYLNNPQATAESFDAHGWFRTGDRVTLHPDGMIQFADRAKDMLKVGGENVAASEIERVLMAVPGVREAAVVGRRHPMLDEVPVAFILPEGGAATAPPDLSDRLMAACRAQLADFKRPHAVRLVDELPRSTIEKIAKAELRRRLEAEDEAPVESDRA